jgi:uroporphyrinogen decarboxylase
MRQPDFRQILKVLHRERPDRPTLFEFFLNVRLYRRLAGTAWTEGEVDRLTDMRRLLAAFRAAGYDYATAHGPLGFRAGERDHAQTISLNQGVLICDRRSFEAYEWPDANAGDYSAFKDVEGDLGGMRLMICGPGGVLENVIRLAGYDNLCFMLADDPALASDLFEAVGSRLVRHYERAVAYRSVGIVMSNDDWGFKTQTMLSPEQMRRYVFPWHRRIVEVAHAAGRPAVLHSCGFAGEIMEDVIAGMGYDGKHSFEDVICPIEECYRRWGARIALLGGIDLDFILKATPAEIEARSRRMLALGERGYALGTGNSVPEYIPDEKYFAMTRAALDERPQ